MPRWLPKVLKQILELAAEDQLRLTHKALPAPPAARR
jgi:hypothetical protein